MSPNFGSLINLLDEKLENVKSQVKRGPSLIYATETVDGITASAILFDFLKRLGTKPTVRFNSVSAYDSSVPEFSADIKIGVGLRAGNEENAINLGVQGEVSAESFGFKSEEASLSTLAHMLRSREYKAPSTHHLAVAGAIADLMNSGDLRELSGLNEAVLEEGRVMGVLGSERKVDLGFGYILPLHRAISISVDPYFAGITGNIAASESILNDNSIPYKKDDRYLTLKDLNEDLLGKLVMVLDQHSESGQIKRNVYYQSAEDESFFMWNIKDLALILELLIASGSTWMAFKLASGMARNSDYDVAWQKAMAQLSQTVDSVNRILSIRERNVDDGKVRRIIANGMLNFRESFMIMKWLSRWRKNHDRLVVLEANQGTDELFIVQPTSEELSRKIEEISKQYGATVKKFLPFLLVIVNVIKAGQFYEELRKNYAGVP